VRQIRGVFLLGMLVSNLVAVSAFALEKIPVDQFPLLSPQRALHAVLQDPRLEICRQDLQHFTASLSSKDLQEIKKQKENFDGEKLKQILSAKVNLASLNKFDIDEFIMGVSIIVPH
jgi:hypothetical protein